MVGRKKTEQLTETVEKQKREQAKEQKTYIEEKITPRTDNAFLIIGYLIVMPMMLLWMLPRATLPLGQLERAVIILCVGFLTAVMILVMDRMGLNERNTYRFYPIEHDLDNDVVLKETHKILSFVQLEKKEYQTPKDFDAQVEKLMKGKNIKGDGGETLKGIPYVAITDKPKNDFILISPGLDIDIAIPMKVGDVTGVWSEGTGKMAATSRVEQVLEPIRRLSDQRLLPVYFLTGSEGICRRYGRTLNLPALISHEELVRLHNKYSMKEGDFFKNLSVAAEARSEDLQKTIDSMTKGSMKTAEGLVMAFLSSIRKGTSTGLPSSRNLAEMLFGTKLKKALWIVAIIAVITINLWVWVIGPRFFPVG